MMIVNVRCLGLPDAVSLETVVFLLAIVSFLKCNQKIFPDSCFS